MESGWPKEIYSGAGIRDLILAAFYNLQHSTPTPFGRLLAECFNLFPEKFRLESYPEWPDARKLARPLRMLREENYISGGPENGYTLAKKGKKRASEVINSLRQKQFKL